MNDILRVSIVRYSLPAHAGISDECLVAVLRDQLVWRDVSRDTYMALANHLPAGARVVIDFGRAISLAPTIDEALAHYESVLALNQSATTRRVGSEKTSAAKKTVKKGLTARQQRELEELKRELENG